MNEKTETAPVHAVVHTPGPWQVAGRRSGDIVTDVLIYAEGLAPLIGCATSEEVSDEAAQANARLIAAAPDLLAALRQCLTNIEQDEYTHNRAFGAGNVARDAIEKATGVRPEEVV